MALFSPPLGGAEDLSSVRVIDCQCASAAGKEEVVTSPLRCAPLTCLLWLDRCTVARRRVRCPKSTTLPELRLHRLSAPNADAVNVFGLLFALSTIDLRS